MKKIIEQLAQALREKRFSVNQGLFLFALPIALIGYLQAKKNESFIAENILPLPKKLKSPIYILSNSGSNNVASLDEFSSLVLSIPLPTRNDRFRECFGITRKMLIVAWSEISSDQVMTAVVEMANFYAFAALDAALEEHPDYKNIPGFKNRLEKMSGDTSFIETLVAASGYTKDELKNSVLADIAVTRNITAHCKKQIQEKTSRIQSTKIDFRPLHLVSAILTELDRV